MTIEKNIQELTQAILGLTEALNSKSSAPQVMEGTEVEVLAKKESKIVETEIIPVKSIAAKKTKAETAKEESLGVSGEEITVETLKEKTLAFSQVKGRDALISVLAEFKAPRGSEVAVADRVKYLKRLEELAAA